jgi:hypothetical protein
LNISRMRLKTPAQRPDPTPEQLHFPSSTISNATECSMSSESFVTSCATAPRAR